MEGVVRMRICPSCGHTWKDKQRSVAGKARWEGVCENERREKMRELARKRWGKISEEKKNASRLASADENSTN